MLFETSDCSRDGRRVLGGKEQTGRRWMLESANNLNRTTAPKRDHWGSARLRLDQAYSEVLFGREDERFRALHIVPHHACRLISEYLDVLPGSCFHFLHFSAVPDDHQPLIR